LLRGGEVSEGEGITSEVAEKPGKDGVTGVKRTEYEGGVRSCVRCYQDVGKLRTEVTVGFGSVASLMTSTRGEEAWRMRFGVGGIRPHAP
jgi:hypothetical protein